MPALSPGRLRDVNIADVGMVMLDADAAGHAGNWLRTDGSLDDGRRTALAERLDQLARVSASLVGDEVQYYSRLEGTRRRIRA